MRARPILLAAGFCFSVLAWTAPASAQVNSPPVVRITQPVSFVLSQGAFSTQVQAVERAQSASSFYNYFSASSHTGFEQARESKLFLFRDTTTGELSLFFTHGIDRDTSGIPTGAGRVVFDITGVPPGAFVAQSDDPLQGGRPELDLSLTPEGNWSYQDNTDGGVIDGFPIDQDWCVTVDPVLFSNVTSWVYHFASGTSIDLQMDEPVSICFTEPADVNVLNIDEGNEASLSGLFDDDDAFDAHVATWTFGDGLSGPATFSPGPGATHHDVDPVFHDYDDDGDYSAVLTVTDSAGAVDDDSVVVHVANVAPAVTPGGPYFVPHGAPLIVSATGRDPGSDDLTFTWTFGDGSPSETRTYFNDGLGPDGFPTPIGVAPFTATDVVTHIWCDPGVYATDVEVVDDDGGVTTVTLSVTATADGPGCNQPPVCAPGADQQVPCDSASLAVIATDPDGDVLSYSWTSSCAGLTFAPGANVADPDVSGAACGATCDFTVIVDDGNGATCSDSVTVAFGDRVGPSLVGVPGDSTVECSAVPTAASVSATDDCDAAPGVVLVETRFDGACADTYRLERTWTATDRCGNSSSATQILMVQDTTDPALAGVPADVTVECNAVPTAASVSATDNCDGAPGVVLVETRFDGACADTYRLERTWTATDRCGNSSSTTQIVTVQDTTDPALVGVPAHVTVECNAVPTAASVSATDNCDGAPEVVLVETRFDGACADTYRLERNWTATDRCGNASSATQIVTVEDTTDPTLAGVPADVTVECDAVPTAASVTATDNCDGAPGVVLVETRFDGACADTYRLERTWTATDRCGNASSATQIVTVEDTTDPALAGVPADVTVECDAVPTAARLSATDNCDGAPGVVLVETRFDGACADTYRLERTWTATDRCGNASSATQIVTVEDTTDPALAGVPADVTVECDAVPTAARVSATDNCDDAPGVAFVETRIDGACPGDYTLRRTWTATDRCANSSSATQVVTVIDTTPPVVTSASAQAYCLWPPNHWYVAFGKDDFAPTISDACSDPVTWRYVGCASDQPDDGLGDGSTSNDCMVAADGSSFAVRAERQGGEPAGRHYFVSITATDACGNTSAPTTIGTIYVPHDASAHDACLKTTKLGLRPNQPLP